ncbi:MAG: tRNA pseudouridine(13) synthase TruD, partial [Halococcoides sp.]
GSGDGSSDDTRTARVAVPNWFGQQRFGSRRAITHRVGLAIVRDDWRGAVRAAVGRPSDREPERTQAARETADRAFERLAAGEDPDWAGALEGMPGHLGQERAMLQRCRERDARSPADFRSAIETAPESLQRLFVHAAQSWLFNRMLSARLERGLPFDRPVAGDVVAFGERREGVFVPDTDRIQRVTADRVATIERHCERGRAVVTHPLVGTDTQIADEGTAIGAIERSVLDDVALAPEDFAGPDPFGSTGDRRAICVATDIAVETVDTGDPELRFALPKGSYATAILREYCKVDPDRL